MEQKISVNEIFECLGIQTFYKMKAEAELSKFKAELEKMKNKDKPDGEK